MLAASEILLMAAIGQAGFSHHQFDTAPLC